MRARLCPRPGSSRPPPGFLTKGWGGGTPAHLSCEPPRARPQDLGTGRWGEQTGSLPPPPPPPPCHFFCLLYSFYKRFISSRPLRNVLHLPEHSVWAGGLTSMNNKGWPLAGPCLRPLLPPVWQHDTKAVWHVYTFQAEPLFRGGRGWRVMGSLQTKPASFLIKSK